jgi:hypothetical protein
MNRQLSITFDVDMIDYISGKSIDEFDFVFSEIKKALILNKKIKTTWFVRIDKDIERRFGSPKSIFLKNKKKIDWLKDNGHEIALHFHSFAHRGSEWSQNLDHDSVSQELQECAYIGRELGLDGVRMGWAYHTNKTMSIISKLGYKYDSTAIPRPQYQFEVSVRDWSVTSSDMFFPSTSDYRVPGNPRHTVLEIPISTVPISTPTDTVNMLRCISPGYKTKFLETALNKVKTNFLVLIAHPVELVTSNFTHYLNV